MTTHRVPAVIALAAALIAPAGLFASSAQAQETPSGRLPVKMGQAVWVTSSEGWEVRGVISDISAATIDVSGEAGTKRLNVTDIRRVATRDSLKNGFWIGASVGAVPALALGSGRVSAKAAGFFVFGSLLYGGVGMLIDHAIEGRRTIYERSSTAAAIQVGPIVTRRGVGLGGTIRW